MQMNFDNPVFLLIWIAALLFIVTPFVIAAFTGIINAYFAAKEKHTAKIASAIGKAFESSADRLMKRQEGGNNSNGGAQGT